MTLRKIIFLIAVSLNTYSLETKAASNAGATLSGMACTDSEKWVLSSGRFRNTPELFEVLTVAPTSPSAGLTKWKNLQRYMKDINAVPSLNGAWGYWYYRAAFALKMYVYAESGFLDLNKKIAADSPYGQATRACINVIQRKLQGLEMSSDFVKNEKQDAEFFKALKGNDLGKIYKLFKLLYEQAKEAKNNSRADSVLVLYAQDLYTRGKFKDAIASAKLVDKKSEKYAQSLLIMAWSSFREKDYGQAVGHAFSLMKLYPQSFEAMEAVWMSSAAFLESCLEKEAKMTLELFKNQVLDADQWVKKNQSEIVRNPYSYYTKHIQDASVPYVIKREWLRSGRLMVLQNHLNSLVDETEQVKEWKAEKNFNRINEIERQIIALTQYYQREMGKEFLKLVSVENVELEAHVEKGQLLETDILGSQSQSDMQGVKHQLVGVGNKGVSITKKVIWVRGGFEKGLRDKTQEVWLDDIGNFVGDFKNACKH